MARQKEAMTARKAGRLLAVRARSTRESVLSKSIKQKISTRLTAACREEERARREAAKILHRALIRYACNCVARSRRVREEYLGALMAAHGMSTICASAGRRRRAGGGGDARCRWRRIMSLLSSLPSCFARAPATLISFSRRGICAGRREAFVVSVENSPSKWRVGGAGARATRALANICGRRKYQASWPRRRLRGGGGARRADFCIFRFSVRRMKSASAGASSAATLSRRRRGVAAHQNIIEAAPIGMSKSSKCGDASVKM